MPAALVQRQPERSGRGGSAWFASDAGAVVLASESEAIRRALGQRPGQPWLWLAVGPAPPEPDGHGLLLNGTGERFDGPLRCALPLPLASESVRAVVVTHGAGLSSAAGMLVAVRPTVVLRCGRL